jgi:hypothetical protein
MPCVYIFKRGQNAGKACGKATCKQHEKLIFPLQKLPLLVISNISEKIVDYSDKIAFNSLLALSETCKEFQNIIEPLWEELYDKLDVTPEQEYYMRNLSYLKRLHLLLDKGCQRCGTPNIKKIHWPQPMRICQECFKEITITQYNLKVKYNIRLDLDDYFVLKRDVERIIHCKLEEYHLNEYKRKLATDLNVPFKDLSKYSKSYLKKYRPDPKRVEKEYYSNLAYDQFNKHIKSLRLPNKYSSPFTSEVTIIFRIIDKESYTSWHDNLHTYYDRYKENIRISEYNNQYIKKLSHLRFLLREHQYYKNIQLEIIPKIHIIIESYRDPSYTIIQLENAMQEASDIIKQFIKDNYYKPLFKNCIANEIIATMLYYPHKTITDYDKFIREFSTKTKKEYKKIITWKDVVKFVDL